MKNYKCDICGKKHTVYHSVTTPEPDYLHGLSKENRNRKVEEVDKMLLVDKSFLLINGIISIEIKDIAEWFSFKTWVRIEIKDFQDRLEEWKKEVFDNPLFGKLENELFFYDETKKLNVKILFPTQEGGSKYVIFEIIDENHIIYTDQKNGISKEQFISWMQKIHHPTPTKNNSKKESFQVSFDKIIQKAKTEYFALQKLFIINVIEESNVVFQILSPTFLNSTTTEEGFVIYLPFDTSGEEAKDELERFKKAKYFEEFEYDDFDGMPTYFLTLENEKKLKTYLKQIIKDVYHREIEKIEFDIFEP